MTFAEASSIELRADRQIPFICYIEADEPSGGAAKVLYFYNRLKRKHLEAADF
ncbi:MAG: hypothetical protein HQL09_01235 [Nitrospirae bacterium]|nr:hypothetical protein [Nitrospirota bacterium]